MSNLVGNPKDQFSRVAAQKKVHVIEIVIVGHEDCPVSSQWPEFVPEVM